MGVRCWNIDMDLLLKFSFFVEQRCETILQPGFNSTVQIGKNRSKHWGKHKHSQNDVVHKCHFA
ncbi:hypothetical protein HN51_007273 [Arachis hypogaea]